MKRTQKESVEDLLKGIEDAKNMREFDYIKDLKMLLNAYTKTSKRDYLALIRSLIDKYSVEETALVHAALLKKCRAGDIEAMRLWAELSKENQTAGEEVQIVDDIPVK